MKTLAESSVKWIARPIISLLIRRRHSSKFLASVQEEVQMDVHGTTDPDFQTMKTILVTKKCFLKSVERAITLATEVKLATAVTEETQPPQQHRQLRRQQQLLHRPQLRPRHLLQLLRHLQRPLLRPLPQRPPPLQQPQQPPLLPLLRQRQLLQVRYKCTTNICVAVAY